LSQNGQVAMMGQSNWQQLKCWTKPEGEWRNENLKAKSKLRETKKIMSWEPTILANHASPSFYIIVKGR